MLKFIVLIIIIILNFTTLYGFEQNVFIENKGQWPSEVKFLAKTTNLNIWVTQDGVLFDYYLLKDKNEDKLLSQFSFKKVIDKNSVLIGHRIKMFFNGYCEATSIEKINKKDNYYNYFIDPDSSKWANYVGLFEQVIINDIYKGIDIKYYFEDKKFRYDFIIHPNSDPSKIRINFQGQDSIFINEKSEIILQTCLGNMIHNSLFVYEQIVNQKKIESKFKKANDSTIVIIIDNFNKNNKLIIDPAVELDNIYSTYLDRQEIENYPFYYNKKCILYFVGLNFKILGPIEREWNYFLYRLNISSNILDSFLLYQFYDSPPPIEISNIKEIGNDTILIVGHVTKNSFIATTGAYQTELMENYPRSYFISKYSLKKKEIIFSTYFGYYIAVSIKTKEQMDTDSSGNIFLYGIVNDHNFPTTANAYQPSFKDTIVLGGSNIDVFISKINQSGTKLISSTLLGGSGREIPSSIIIDKFGKVIITGLSSSQNFPLKNPIDSINNPRFFYDYDSFITRMDNNLEKLEFSTLWGGGDFWDEIYNISFISNYYYLVFGRTNSKDFMVSSDVYNNDFPSTENIFISKINPSSNKLLFSSFGVKNKGIPGSTFMSDYIRSHNNSSILLIGNSTDYLYPVTEDAYYPHPGGAPGVITLFDEDFKNIIYSTHWPGKIIHSLPTGNDSILILCKTYVNNYPVTKNSYDTTYNSNNSDGSTYALSIIKFKYLASINNLNISDVELCSNDSLQVKYSIEGKFNNDNKFLVYLSDKDGNFNNQIKLLEIESDSITSLLLNFPDNLEFSNQYRIRIESTNPKTLSENSNAFTVKPSPKKPTISIFDNILASDSKNGNQWFKNGNIIEGAIEQFHKVLESGYYSVIVTNEFLCKSERSDSVWVEISKIDDELIDDFKLTVTPNPLSENATIFFTLKKDSNIKIYLFDILGKEYITILDSRHFSAGQHSIDFDTKNLPAGIYYLSVNSGNFDINERIIIIK